ncbi:MAG: hypothetical protein P4L41_02885 [Flavipsychrobacter sp.]|nr:hypothetical protein [Flavipsychrobacter sp.]
MTVSHKLINPDKLTIAARDHLTQKGIYLHNGLARCFRDNLISIKAAPKNVNRALRFMDRLIKILKAKGHDVYVRYDSTYVCIEQEEIKISLRETLKREMVDNGRWKSAKYSPTGILAFKMERFPDKEWKDGKLSIEEQLPQIIAKLELEGMELREKTQRRQKQQAEDEIKKKIERELRQKREKELLAFKTLLVNASRFHQATILRNYLNKVEDSKLKANVLTEETIKWLDWARKKVNWYDPLIESVDDLLSGIDRDILALEISKRL